MERQIRDRFMSYRLSVMTSQMIELVKVNSNNEMEELIDLT